MTSSNPATKEPRVDTAALRSLYSRPGPNPQDLQTAIRIFFNTDVDLSTEHVMEINHQLSELKTTKRAGLSIKRPKRALIAALKASPIPVIRSCR